MRGSGADRDDTHRAGLRGNNPAGTVSVLTDLGSSPLGEYADHLIVTSVEGIQAGPSLTAMVAAVQAVLSELTDDDAIRASRRVQQMRQELDLLDDQP
ncbi:hypothetical protein OG568_54785 (plasmid) [Streptomyces sp. NBC_01450]|uniref:hypothetical protein n=1 Tax=Streptomyces sp. NBC_01450 TaxID=2903871 RepID=UPI002E356361|nr:hypothetical protein [Streptomyces sp. NBC_01450]